MYLILKMISNVYVVIKTIFNRLGGEKSMLEQERLEEISRKKKVEQARREIKSPKEDFIQTKTNLEKKDRKNGKGFQIRLLFASALFLIFLVGKQEGLSYNGWSCEKIVKLVQYDVGMDIVEDKIISVFNRLN